MQDFIHVFDFEWCFSKYSQQASIHPEVAADSVDLIQDGQKALESIDNPVIIQAIQNKIPEAEIKPVEENPVQTRKTEPLASPRSKMKAKIMLLGVSSVGKTSIFKRKADDKFETNQTSTIGIIFLLYIYKNFFKGIDVSRFVIDNE